MRMALALAAIAAAPLTAHDMTLRFEPREPAVLLYVSYDGVEPAVGADVEIFSPESPKSPFQLGSTDRRGVFSFVPDVKGAWRAVADDGFGHRAEVVIGVDWNAAPQDAAARGGQDWRNIAAGLGLIAGLTGFSLWFQARKRLTRDEAR
jgi:nickel transport protein